MRLTRSTLPLLALACLSGLPAALAQTSSGGSVRGYVRDPQGGVLPGATVTASSPSAPSATIAVSDKEGFYRLLELPPGEYTITAELQGFAKFVRPGVQVRAGLNLGVYIDLTVAGQTEAVTVQADTPMLETQTAVQSVNLSGELIRNLPLGTARQWSDFLSVTPGATTRTIASLSISHQIRGADFASNVIQVDGANIAGASSGSEFSVNILPGAIEDVQVKTAAMDAAAPLGVGAVISIATRSGTDGLRGSASIDVQRRSWTGSNVAGGTTGALESAIPEADLGGPILKHRLWFFGAYRYERSLQGISRTAEQIQTLQALVPGWKTFDRRFGGHFALAKLTGQWSSRQRSELTYQYMPRENFSAGATDAALFSRTVLGGKLSLGLRHSTTWSPHFTSRLNASYSDNAQQTPVRDDKPVRRIYSSAFPSAGGLVGSGLLATLDNGGTGFSGESNFAVATLSGDVTLLRSGWLGRHELQAGFLLQRQFEDSVNGIANGGFARESNVLRDPRNAGAGFVPFWREVYDVDHYQISLGHSDDVAFYAQDAWQPTSRLSLNAGLRVDILHRVDKLFGITVQESTELGPRLGLNYSFTGDRRHAARASWARIHDLLSNNRASAGSSSAGRTDLYDLDLNGTFETRFLTPASTVLTRNRVFDLARSQPYINELAVGYRGQLPGRTSVDLGFVRREYRNRTTGVEINGIYEGSVFRGYRDESQNEIYRVTENTWNWQVYQGLELQAAKRTERLEAILGYTRAWHHMAGTWQPNDPASFIQPAAFPNNRGIGGVRSASSASPLDANSLSGTHMTTENLGWLDHTLNLGLVWRAPGRLVVATTYLFQTGSWSGPVVTRVAAADPRFGPTTLRLSNGRVVPNPLATTIRFAHPTRSEGQLQLPDLRVWNLRLGRAFGLKGRRSFELALDVFNVTNAGAPTLFSLTGGNQQFSPEFGRTQSVQPPRSARLRARVAF